MFRIEFLKIDGHQQLGDIELFFSENNDKVEIKKPYTTLIIGVNGTGKSFILRTIAEIFRQFKAYSTSDKKDFSLPFSIHLRYRLNNNTFEILSKRLTPVSRQGLRREYIFYKNRPLKPIIYNDSIIEKKTGYEISHKELEFPNKILVNSIIPTDRFIQRNSNRGDYYQYLGARSTSSTTSTKSSVRRTIRHIFNATYESKDFIESLKKLLKFLGFEESFQVVYRTKLNKLFFSKELTISNFRKFYEEWWDEDFKFTNRKKENPIWSIPYYNKHFKSNDLETEKLINYLLKLPDDKSKYQNKPKSSSKIIMLDLFDSEVNEEDLIMISHLENLDIINLEGIRVRKSKKQLSISDISSGEYHLLISLIGLFSNITNNSLILIDEPEISLHPNWQMRYISFLKLVFSSFPSCHFVLTTHSHFFVSDLEGESSSVIALDRNNSERKIFAHLLESDPFGWSAENVLLNVFGVATNRNYYIAERLSEIFKEASKSKSPDLRKYKNELIQWHKQLKSNDPLHYTIERIIEKAGWLD